MHRLTNAKMDSLMRVNAIDLELIISLRTGSIASLICMVMKAPHRMGMSSGNVSCILSKPMLHYRSPQTCCHAHVQ
jgi:hypothetical protein